MDERGFLGLVMSLKGIRHRSSDGSRQNVNVLTQDLETSVACDVCEPDSSLSLSHPIPVASAQVAKEST